MVAVMISLTFNTSTCSLQRGGISYFKQSWFIFEWCFVSIVTVALLLIISSQSLKEMCNYAICSTRRSWGSWGSHAIPLVARCHPTARCHALSSLARCLRCLRLDAVDTLSTPSLRFAVRDSCAANALESLVCLHERHEIYWNPWDVFCWTTTIEHHKCLRRAESLPKLPLLGRHCNWCPCPDAICASTWQKHVTQKQWGLLWNSQATRTIYQDFRLIGCSLVVHMFHFSFELFSMWKAPCIDSKVFRTSHACHWTHTHTQHYRLTAWQETTGNHCKFPSEIHHPSSPSFQFECQCSRALNKPAWDSPHQWKADSKYSEADQATSKTNGVAICSTILRGRTILSKQTETIQNLLIQHIF